MDSVREGEGGKICENGIETCKISCMKRVASPWRIPWTEEPGRLQSMSLQTVGHTWVTNHSHSLLQGIFLIQASNLGLLHCRRILYHLSHQGSWLSHSNKRRTCYTALFPFLMKKGLCLIEMHK